MTIENLVIKSEEFNDLIGLELYDRDVVIYPDIPNATGNNVWQIEDYIYNRQTYVDEKFSQLKERVACTSIDIPATLTISDLEPFSLSMTLTPADTTDRVFYSSSNNSIIQISDYGVVTPITNGTANINIRCGSQTAICAATVDVSQDEYSTRVEELIDNGGWSEMPSGSVSALHSVGSAIHLPEFNSESSLQEVDVFMYDASGNSLGYKGRTPYNGDVIITPPDTYSINIHLYNPAKVYSTLTILSGGTDLTSNVTSWTAGILDTNTGVITEDPTSHTWFSNLIEAPAMHTIATTCIGEAAYNYKGCLMYNGDSYIGAIGAEDQYKDDYNHDVSASPTAIRLTVNDMDLESHNPTGKVRIFNFNKNANT